MKRHADRLGGTGIESDAGGTARTAILRAAIRAAVVHYVRELEDGRAISFPRFGRGRDRGAALIGVDLGLDGETATAIEREAERQHVAVEQLLAHALFVYLADVDTAFA